jgi:hypothetical protein
MSSVSYRMSGSGSWQNLLPDQTSRRLYSEIYPMGAPLPTGSGQVPELLSVWKKAGIVRLESEKVIPLGPIMTDGDLIILKPWFQDISNFMVQAFRERLGDYRDLARTLAEGHSSSEQDIENILTILICALTLDSWVFSLLRRELIGTYPFRGPAGNFFFWGYAFVHGPKRIFGFTTYTILEAGQLHMIRSHGLDRQAIKESLRHRNTWDYLDSLILDQGRVGRGAPKPPRPDHSLLQTSPSLQSVGLITPGDPSRLAIPVFDPVSSGTISVLCRETSVKIMVYFESRLDELNTLSSRCSFAQCSRPDVLCMLFHLAYSYAADQWVEKGVISDFPKAAGGEWGVWIS